jgi:drug/metabolite transporter (DMT)-like permease
MTLTAVCLVLGAAFLHAYWNYLSKKAMGGVYFVWLVAVAASVIYLPVAIYAFVRADIFGAKELALCLISACIHLVYMQLLQTGYQRGELSLVYPLARSTGPVVATLAAIFFLGEQPTKLALLGGIVMVTGIFFLTSGTRSQHGSRHRASLIFGICTGVIIGCYTIWDGYLVSIALISPLLLDYFTNLGRALLMLPYIYKNRLNVTREWRRSQADILQVALLMPAAYILILYAMRIAPISYIAPAREISVLFGVLLGSILLGEGHLLRRLSWSIVVVSGMFILASH